MTYTYRLIVWRCRCGEIAPAVLVGITSAGDLLGTWMCVCGTEVKALIPMEKLIADIPLQTEKEGFTEKDEQWLHALRIRDADPV